MKEYHWRRRIESLNRIAMAVIICLFIVSAVSAGIVKEPSLFDQEVVRMKYQMLNQSSAPVNSQSWLAENQSGAFENDGSFSGEAPKYKSPGKAFVLSLAVPGLGQYYYGSRVKPFIFLGAEAASWIFYFKLHGDGEDITDEFEAFQRANWSRDRYSDYLLQAYGYEDDDSIPAGVPGVTHHLPNTETQQFFEMTGKYDQFAWGWEDALLDDRGLYEYTGVGSDTVPKIVSSSTTPFSAKRFEYEERRNDANNKFDQARRMIYLSLANRLISGFEALFRTKAINRARGKEIGGDGSGSWRVNAKLKSVYSKRDTPYLSVTYKF